MRLNHLCFGDVASIHGSIVRLLCVFASSFFFFSILLHFDCTCMYVCCMNKFFFYFFLLLHVCLCVLFRTFCWTFLNSFFLHILLSCRSFYAFARWRFCSRATPCHTTHTCPHTDILHKLSFSASCSSFSSLTHAFSFLIPFHSPSRSLALALSLSVLFALTQRKNFCSLVWHTVSTGFWQLNARWAFEKRCDDVLQLCFEFAIALVPLL